jgi:hypothetical protein
MLFAQLPKLSCFEAGKQRKTVDTLTFKTFHTRPYENICKSPRQWGNTQIDNISQTREYSGSLHKATPYLNNKYKY